MELMESHQISFEKKLFEAGSLECYATCLIAIKGDRKPRSTIHESFLTPLCLGFFIFRSGFNRNVIFFPFANVQQKTDNEWEKEEYYFSSYLPLSP